MTKKFIWVTTHGGFQKFDLKQNKLIGEVVKEIPIEKQETQKEKEE